MIYLVYTGSMVKYRLSKIELKSIYKTSHRSLWELFKLLTTKEPSSAKPIVQTIVLNRRMKSRYSNDYCTYLTIMNYANSSSTPDILVDKDYRSIG